MAAFITGRAPPDEASRWVASLGTNLARAGVAPQLAKRVMRNGDHKTTLNHYTILGLVDTARAMQSLPSIADATQTIVATATGTESGAASGAAVGLEIGHFAASSGH